MYLTESALFAMIELISLITMIAIVILSSLSLYWHLMFISKTKWGYYSSLKLYNAFVSLCFIFVFGFLVYRFFAGLPIDISFYGSCVIRPVVLLQAGSSAASGRARLVALEASGGEVWRLRNEKLNRLRDEINGK